MLDRKKILTAFLGLIESELKLMRRAAEHARQSAISDEVKTQEKYDTQGLEASYLAGAQAKRAEDLRMAYSLLSRLCETAQKNAGILVEGAGVRLRNEKNQVVRTYILLPKEGGLKTEVDSEMIFSLSSSSPLGQELIGRREGDEFEVEIDSKFYHYLIEAIF